MRAQSLALCLPWSTGRRLLKNAKAKQSLLANMEIRVDWSHRRKQKQWRKVNQNVQDKLHAWIIDHEIVIKLLILKYALLKLNLVTGIKERVQQLFLQITVCELHYNILQPVKRGRAT
jgi:hypothetical protein